MRNIEGQIGATQEGRSQDTGSGAAAPATAQPARRARRTNQGIKVSDREVVDAYADKYPPIITLKEAAEIARLSPNTITTQMSRNGRYHTCAIRGKPLRFWRDRFVKEVMAG